MVELVYRALLGSPVQDPFTRLEYCVQLALLPPLVELQVQVHGQLPETVVPERVLLVPQRLVVGAVDPVLL